MVEVMLLSQADGAIPNLTQDEVAVIKAAATGADCAFPTMVEIRPDLLRWMCSDPSAKALIDPRGLRIENAHISGTLDLRNIVIEFLLRIHGCIVDGDIILADARLRTVGFNGTTCEQLNAHRSLVAGEVFLSSDGDRPFRSASVRFIDATINGNLTADNAEIGPARDDYPAFVIDRANVRGDFYLRRARIKGSLTAFDAQVGAFHGSAMRVSANPRRRGAAAVALVRSTVTGWVVFGPEAGAMTAIDGPVNLSGSIVGGSVDFTHAYIGPAPEADQQPGRQETAAAKDDPSIAETSVAEPDAEVLPVLIDVQLTKIGSHLLLRHTRVADGRVLIAGAEIGKDLNCESLHLARSDDHDGHGPHANDGQPPRLPARSGSQKFSPDIAIISARIGETLNWKALLPPEAVVFLSRTTTERLAYTSVVYWPPLGRLALGGLQYRYIDGDTRFRRQRVAGPARWLRKRQESGPLPFGQPTLLRLANAIAGTDGTHLRWLRLYTRKYYDPQSYDTLAAALRSMGRENDAARVLIARADDRRRAQGIMAILFGMPYRLLVGNGFRTWWAAVWIILFTLVGTAVFNGAHQHGELSPVKPAVQIMPFQPFVYSLDVLLPIVNLGQADSYIPIAPKASGVRDYRG